MAVAKGQSEAGLSLGLKRSALLRLIVLPQALRIMLPPMGNQYLNLAKNTSLGIAVAYPEIVAVGQTIYNLDKGLIHEDKSYSERGIAYNSSNLSFSLSFSINSTYFLPLCRN